jgi:glycosyltransferase involved in cell wall biosynthesis
VIHTHFGTFDIPAALMRLRRRALAVFWHAHTPLREDPRTKLRNTIRYASLGRLVSAILCVSPDLRGELRARHAPERKLLDFPNAIDTRRFSPITTLERSAARHSLGLADEARVVLHFGWSWQRKGGELMLQTAEILALEPELVVLTVLGEDRALPPSVAGHPIVRPLPPTNDVTRLFAAADVFLSSSEGEGMPLAVLEALACGLPVVATDIPVQARLLAGLPGAVTVPSEPAAVAAGIRAMLSLSDRDLAEHAQAARRSLAPLFALDAWARRLLDLYERAV